MYELKTNTATRIAVGPLVDADDLTAQTSLNVTAMSVQIYRMAQDGSAVVRTAFTPTASGGNNDMVHVASDTAGMYDLELTAAQLNFLGPARITFYDETGFLIHWVDILVLSAAYYDFKYGTTLPNVNVVQAGGADWANETRLNRLDATISSRSTLTAAQVWANSTRTLSSFGTLVSDIWSNATRTLTAISDSAGVTTLLSRISAALTFTGGNVNAHVKAKDNLDFGALEKTSLNAATPSVTVSDKTGFSLATAPPTATQVRQEMDNNSTKLANLNATITSRLAADNYTAPANAAITDIKTVTDKLDDTLELDSGKNRFTADALAEAPTGGGGGSGPTAEEIAEAVWDEAITDHLDAGTTGNALNAAGSTGDPWATPLPGSYGAGSAGRIIGDNLDDKVTSRSTLTAAQVWAYDTRTLTAISDSAGITTLLSRISQALGFSNGNVNVHVKGKDNIDFSAAEKASLNAATPAVTVSDKTGFSLTPVYDVAKTAATQASVNAIPTNPVLANDARLDNLDAAISSRLADYEYIAPANADIAAVKAKTDNLPSSPAAVGSEMVLTSAYDAAKTAASQSSVDTIDGNVDDIKLKTDALTFGKAEQVDVNVRSINYETITGTGRVGDEFGVD